MSRVLRVLALDHIVLRAADVERSLRFYQRELGLAPVRVDAWRRGEAPFPSVRVDDHTIIDILARDRDGENVDHFCLVVEPTDFEAITATGRFRVVDGPATRFGARGDGTALYVLDPDGNTVELRYYDRA
jgi:catechol 2,3-dioxygenase-like lactoylglutathione lyase family enzyme